ARALDSVDVAAPRKRSSYAGGPQVHIAPRALLQGATAHDVGERHPPARFEDASRLSKDPTLHRGEVDHAVRDDDIEALILKRKIVDADRKSTRLNSSH